MKYINKIGIGLFTAAAFTAVGAVALRENLAVRHDELRSDKIISPVKLAVITDLHSTFYGKKQEKLLCTVREEKTDAVLFIGDIVDDRMPMCGANRLFAGLGRHFPCYYVSGNHEFRSGKIDAIKKKIRRYGITVLEGDAARLRIGMQNILIAGVDDPAGFSKNNPYGWQKQLQNCISAAAANGNDIYRILLCHRPERNEVYAASGFGLILCGHAHGGQVRIPYLLNGLYAPNQGLFPKYAGGCYELGQDVSMIVSRGLCRNELPRVFNLPELVIVELKSKDPSKG